MTNYQLLELKPESELLGIRFKTENFSSLAKIPLQETKDLRVELSQIIPIKSLIKLNQLNGLVTTTERIHFLENFIETSFRENSHKQDSMVLSVAHKIRMFKGIVKVKDLAKSHGISLRQLERRFKSYIGLTVKEFSNTVRFNYTKRLIATNTNRSLLEIALDMGFFDHSHMTNEVHRISGESPSFFR